MILFEGWPWGPIVPHMDDLLAAGSLVKSLIAFG